MGNNRFTDTTKWRNIWFRDELNADSKLMFMYLCDKCDIGGFWKLDIKGASFETGLDGYVVENSLKLFGKRVEIVDDVLWIPTFIEKQSNLPLNPKNPCHRGIVKTLEKHKSLFEGVLQLLERKGLQCPSKELRSSISKSKSNGKGKGKGNEVEKVYESWNCICDNKVESLSKGRKGKLQARLKEPLFVDNFSKIFTTIKNTPFLCGDNDRGWKADFDWIITNDTNYAKVLEGKYNDNNGKTISTGQGQSNSQAQAKYNSGEYDYKGFEDVPVFRPGDANLRGKGG